ncbi:YbhB/YbcL family Raf kinase inhibitor-like protein [Rhizobium sp. CFBP 8762]|uniref:YbhB/YbcL family Raf kinase inhibitor-like protein n=1 Tax=Rhizobium sp. CFBP 8762 TaxID=2775279 RepID=UPI00177B06C5|nr:YbhB/YbcL family Raf kinase inhibitor-like protein [Rhizobium sp. CFBP 8762]MBD8554244.1 YbhB/YbcL family Raf kinase inhibitor-like protein [Rhizobium sp. CFBP 8762]
MTLQATRNFVVAALAATTALCGTVQAQVKGKVGEYSDVTVRGSILEPAKAKLPDDATLEKRIKAPEGFKVQVYARDLINPRMVAVSDKGIVYATRRSVGDVIMITDADGDGRAESVKTVASRDQMHGIAFDGNKVFLITVNDVYTADVNDDGTFGPLTRIINDLPDGGQHANRTLRIGPDNMLYITVGSTCNECQETNPENATILRASKDGKSREIFASGLRNTIGFDWESGSGSLYGMDHGIDWLGDEEQIEEVNKIEQGKKYGWPYVYGMGELNPHMNPPDGITLEQWKSQSEQPLAGYTPHAAPMQMTFYRGGQFPEAYRGDAFVAMRGSWNRRPPSGYELARVDFEKGKPTKVEPFLNGFLLKDGDSFDFLGRPTGVAEGKDGSLFVADDSNGVIYRVSYDGADQRAEAQPAAEPNTVPDPKPMDKAIDAVDAKDSDALSVTADFKANEGIPVAHAADGDNASPALQWGKGPEGTQSYVLIVDDPDAAKPKPFTHWLVYDIPASVTTLPEGVAAGSPVVLVPKGPLQGVNSQGSIGYTGPKPPVGDPAHHYGFQLFALDVPSLKLEPGAKRADVLNAMKGHILAKGEIIGLFERK